MAEIGETNTQDQHQASSPWYFAHHGKRYGPGTLAQMKKLIAKGHIQSHTKVWHQAGQWRPASSFPELKAYFSVQKSTLASMPPPLVAEDVNNVWAWMLVIVPFLGIMLETLLGWPEYEHLIIIVLLNTGICSFDYYKLKQAGHQRPKTWHIFVVPFYLWRRFKMLHQENHYFLAWIFAFFLSIPIGMSIKSALIEEAACKLVTEIIQEKASKSQRCLSVTLDEEVTNKFYLATAITNRGYRLNIQIELLDRGNIYVTVD